MEGHAIFLVRVDTLDNIDLAAIRPRRVYSVRPEGGPGAASLGHVGKVTDEEAVVVGLLAFDTDGGTAVGADLFSVVGAEVDASGKEPGKTLVVGGLGGNVVDKTVGWVRLVDEVEVVEEVLLGEVVDQLVVLGSGQTGEGSGGKGEGGTSMHFV